MDDRGRMTEYALAIGAYPSFVFYTGKGHNLTFFRPVVPLLCRRVGYTFCLPSSHGNLVRRPIYPGTVD
jgi:hypothetical protein